jgi:hypothetical protein
MTDEASHSGSGDGVPCKDGAVAPTARLLAHSASGAQSKQENPPLSTASRNRHSVDRGRRLGLARPTNESRNAHALREAAEQHPHTLSLTLTRTHARAEPSPDATQNRHHHSTYCKCARGSTSSVVPSLSRLQSIHGPLPSPPPLLPAPPPPSPSSSTSPTPHTHTHTKAVLPCPVFHLTPFASLSPPSPGPPIDAASHICGLALTASSLSLLLLLLLFVLPPPAHPQLHPTAHPVHLLLMTLLVLLPSPLLLLLLLRGRRLVLWLASVLLLRLCATIFYCSQNRTTCGH